MAGAGGMILFAGPSLWSGAGRLSIPPGIDLHPPAARDDIWNCIARRPAAIGLVDGVFGTAPSVAHKEILAALDAGIAVLGAASLGALRAAELGLCGMEGVGSVHAAFAAGSIRRDDAVLVAHAPAELAFRPLSVALVDAEAVVRAAPVDPEWKPALLRRARRLPYHLRSWESIADGVCDPALLYPHIFSLKQRDCAELIRRLPLAGAQPHRRARYRPNPYVPSPARASPSEIIALSSSRANGR